MNRDYNYLSIYRVQNPNWGHLFCYTHPAPKWAFGIPYESRMLEYVEYRNILHHIVKSYDCSLQKPFAGMFISSPQACLQCAFSVWSAPWSFLIRQLSAYKNLKPYRIPKSNHRTRHLYSLCNIWQAATYSFSRSPTSMSDLLSSTLWYLGFVFIDHRNIWVIRSLNQAHNSFNLYFSDRCLISEPNYPRNFFLLYFIGWHNVVYFWTNNAYIPYLFLISDREAWHFRSLLMLLLFVLNRQLWMSQIVSIFIGPKKIMWKDSSIQLHRIISKNNLEKSDAAKYFIKKNPQWFYCGVKSIFNYYARSYPFINIARYPTPPPICLCL